jgi:hypothetical protein
MKRLALIFTGILFYIGGYSQINEDETGAWYMYFFNTEFGESNFGVQGDIQYRNWNIMGDLEQLLLRGGVTYRPENTKVKFTLGYANITSGAYGESDETSNESRIYQEMLLPQKVGERFYLTHRYRYEQRFVENQDFRTRFRYALFINAALNKTSLGKNTVYLALYNEIFINGERDIGDERRVELFDRNRTYLGAGYGITDNLRVQAGWMKQITDNWSKGQLQLSLHHKIGK